MGCEVIATAWKGYSGVVIDCRDCFEVMGELRAMRFLFVPAQMVWRKFYGLEADFASHAAELEAGCGEVARDGVRRDLGGPETV